MLFVYKSGPSLIIYEDAVICVTVDDISRTDLTGLWSFSLFYCAWSKYDVSMDIGLKPAELIEAANGFNLSSIEQFMLVFRTKLVFRNREVERKVVGHNMKNLLFRYMSRSPVFICDLHVLELYPDALLFENNAA